MNKSKTIRISEKAYKIARKEAFKNNITIIKVIDKKLGVENKPKS